LISFFPTKGEGAIGALDWTDEERKRFAKQSAAWTCPDCEMRMDEVLPGDGEEASTPEDAKVDVSAFNVQYEKDLKKEEESTSSAVQETPLPPVVPVVSEVAREVPAEEVRPPLRVPARQPQPAPPQPTPPPHATLDVAILFVSLLIAFMLLKKWL
jgi:ubiquitin-conjugating enzyme E2 J1